MLKWLKLSHHHHFGRFRPHEHTSYLPLGLLLLITGLSLVAYTVYAATPYDGPESSSISLTGAMPGKAPSVATVIQKPTNQQHFSDSPITISGTCPKNTVVEIYKNKIFAGSTMCSDSGKFSLKIDLMIGKNSITAQAYDALNQPGPISKAVIVYYDALPLQAGAISSVNFGGDQLLINTDAVFRGTFPDQKMSMPISILGGIPPYAINIQWGDSTNKIISRNNNASFNVDHVYKKAGTYQITIQASDLNGRVAFLTVASIVNGRPDTAKTSAGLTSDIASQLLLLWPLYVSAVTVVVSFFIGEWREKRVLARHGLLLPT